MIFSRIIGMTKNVIEEYFGMDWYWLDIRKGKGATVDATLVLHLLFTEEGGSK